VAVSKVTIRASSGPAREQGGAGKHSPAFFLSAFFGLESEIGSQLAAVRREIVSADFRAECDGLERNRLALNKGSVDDV